jgi:hypothetical protein
LRIDVVQFASLNERSDAGPVRGALIVAGEECVLAIQHNRADASFDNVGVEFDATIVEETGEPIPMMQAVADRFGNRRLARNARELLLKPG